MVEEQPVRLVLIRHAEQIRVGDDGPLTARGREQATALAAALPLDPDDVLVSSPLLRAVQTAEAFGRPPKLYDDLSEFRFGPAWDWPLADDGGHLALWRPTDGNAEGETMAGFQSRVDRVVEDLVAMNSSRRVVMCAHSGVIDAILRWVFGSTPATPWTTEAAVAHASVTELHHWPRGRHPAGAPRHTLLVRIGDVAHLPEALVTGQ